MLYPSPFELPEYDRRIWTGRTVVFSVAPGRIVPVIAVSTDLDRARRAAEGVDIQGTLAHRHRRQICFESASSFFT